MTAFAETITPLPPDTEIPYDDVPLMVNPLIVM